MDGLPTLANVYMVADEPLRKDSKVTPFIAPLVSCLNSSELLTRCSACFRELDDDKQPKLSEFVRYCSNPTCASTDYPIHVSSGEQQLFIALKNNPELWTEPDTTDLRLALRLLHVIPSSYFTAEIFPDRIMGLLLNDFKTHFGSVRGPRLMALAKANTEGRVYEYCGHKEFEILALNLVLTNAVKVDYQGRYLGLALYDHRISWINHSCDPNAKLLFNHYDNVAVETTKMRISPSDPRIQMNDVFKVTDLGLDHHCGPRVTVELNRDLKAGEEIKISYLDPYSIWSQEWNQSHRCKFHCGCNVCCSVDDSSHVEASSHGTSSCPRSSHEKETRRRSKSKPLMKSCFCFNFSLRGLIRARRKSIRG